MHFKQDESWAALDVAQVREFKFQNHPTVEILNVKWDLFWHIGDEDAEQRQLLEEINGSLTRAAIAAIETGEASTFYRVAQAFSAFGAADSEPLRQFAWLWEMVYGEE